MRYADRLEGEVVAFTFKAEDGAFAVARVRSAEGEVVAVGALGHLREGQRLVAHGQWTLDLRHGRQFKVESVLGEDPRTLDGLERYLASALGGVGPELAHRIVEHFGLDAMRIIEDSPERLTEVAGIGPKTRDKIADTWTDEVRGRELEVTLRGHGLGPGLVRRVVKQFGKDAAGVVARSPYRLTEVAGIGFRTADGIARAQGVSREDPGRVDAAIRYCITEAEEEGHCYLPEGVLLARLGNLEVPAPAASAGVERMALARRVVRRPGPVDVERPVLSPEMDGLERGVARDIVRRLGDIGREPASSGVDVEGLGRRLGLVLNGEQQAAVDLALATPVCVLTGGPGTGKTTIVRVLMRAAKERGEAWKLASPTGRAARRLAEATGEPATTLHRLLEWGRTGFTRDESRPVEAAGVLVDEASMLDLRLFAALLAALPPTARLVLVGDVDQLPSVGAGQVLADLIGCGRVPVARLLEVYRQAADSGIVRNAHRVNRGEAPVSSEKEEGRRDFFLLPKEDAEEAAQTLVRVVKERLPANGFDPIRDVQVLTPMHNGVLGTTALNQRLQAALNPDGEAVRHRGKELRVGDRVIQLRNDYELELFNGDVGRVLKAMPGALEVEVDGRVLAIEGDALDNLDLAYAISIHKSQGSEYPAVVVALHRSHFVLLRRNLLYTALTRAKRFACIVGSPTAVRIAVGRLGEDRRYTGLGSLLATGG